LAKIIDYPRASLRSALSLAEAVDSFAGSCSAELAAEKLGKRVSGAFAAVVGAASKYRLLESKAGKLWVTALYRDFKLSYTPEDAAKQLQGALLSPPLFRAIYERFKGQKLPVGHFEKLLIKEFDAPEAFASRLEKYFLEGAKQCRLLGADNILKDSTQVTLATIQTEYEDQAEADEDVDGPSNEQVITAPSEGLKVTQIMSAGSEEYWLNLRGPGMDFSFEIRELDDLDVIQVMIKKIEKALRVRENTESR